MKKFGTVVMTLFVSILTIGILLPVINKSTGGKIEEQFDKWLNVIPEKTPEPVPDTRQNLVKIDLRNDLKNSALNQVKFFEFFNTSATKSIFTYDGKHDHDDPYSYAEDAYFTYSGNIYKDNGGLKLGTSSKHGYFFSTFKDGFTYNRLKIIGKNYSTFSTSTRKYSCDTGILYVNDILSSKSFGTNEQDETKEAPTEEILYSYDKNYDYLNISADQGRIVIFQIELWTESIVTNQEEFVVPENYATSVFYAPNDSNIVCVDVDALEMNICNERVLVIAFRDPDEKISGTQQFEVLEDSVEFKNSYKSTFHRANGWSFYLLKNLRTSPILLTAFEIRILGNGIYKEMDSATNKFVSTDEALAKNIVMYSSPILPSIYLKDKMIAKTEAPANFDNADETL